MSKKQRLDVLLVERSLLESRQKAQGTIMSGLVFVNGQRVDKPGAPVDPDGGEIRLLRHLAVGEVAGVGPLQADDPAVAAQLPGQWCEKGISFTAAGGRIPRRIEGVTA